MKTICWILYRRVCKKATDTRLQARALLIQKYTIICIQVHTCSLSFTLYLWTKFYVEVFFFAQISKHNDFDTIVKITQRWISMLGLKLKIKLHMSVEETFFFSDWFIKTKVDKNEFIWIHGLPHTAAYPECQRLGVA